MTTEHQRIPSPANQNGLTGWPPPRRFEGFACDLNLDACPVDDLRAALAREQTLIRQRDALVQEQETLRREAEHRLLNGLQMVVSLLSLQSRASANPLVAQQLALAASRVATIERVHRRLHDLDGTQAVAFKSYLDDLCADVSSLVATEDHPGRVLTVESVELHLPTATAIPLGFIVNELITNALKHGRERIAVRLASNEGGGYALSVSNGGAALPETFDPAASTGLGMKIVQSFIRQIGGTLHIGRSAGGDGACFVVRFALPGAAVRAPRPNTEGAAFPG
jgi:two-component sensor histidine kinase